MTNADKFKNIFGLYATELWSMPEKDFLKWLNSKVVNCSEIPNNSDTISRQAALETIRTMQTYKLFSGDDMILIDKAEVQTELMMLPPAEPERKTGHWIEMSSANHTYKCSECGRLLVNVTDGKNNVSKHYPYCHCGAKMEGGEAE